MKTKKIRSFIENKGKEEKIVIANRELEEIYSGLVGDIPGRLKEKNIINTYCCYNVAIVIIEELSSLEKVKNLLSQKDYEYRVDFVIETSIIVSDFTEGDLEKIAQEIEGNGEEFSHDNLKHYLADLVYDEALYGGDYEMELCEAAELTIKDGYFRDVKVERMN